MGLAPFSNFSAKKIARKTHIPCLKAVYKTMSFILIHLLLDVLGISLQENVIVLFCKVRFRQTCELLGNNFRSFKTSRYFSPTCVNGRVHSHLPALCCACDRHVNILPHWLSGCVLLRASGSVESYCGRRLKASSILHRSFGGQLQRAQSIKLCFLQQCQWFFFSKVN